MIKINIPSATDAKKSIEGGAYKKAEKQASMIERAITSAIANGQNYVHGDGWLEPALKIILEDKGYICNLGSARNESFFSISW